MADHDKLETTVQTLLTAAAGWSDTVAGKPIAERTSYCDAAIDLAAWRGARTDEAARDLVKSTEFLLGDLDDLAMSNRPEWQGAADALNPYLVN